MVLFILTTNRPAELEEALTSRPGRVDQAIEFPRPDDNGRRQLIKLYSGGLAFDTDLEELIVRKTKGPSGAFIKELMRRSAQFLLEDGGRDLAARHIESALDEMLFSGGELNSKLLGMERSA
jgi:ATP-dependent 26S proteasome regulatory subunit